MVVLQHSWNLNCKQCVFVLCFICWSYSWSWQVGTTGLDYKTATFIRPWKCLQTKNFV